MLLQAPGKRGRIRKKLGHYRTGEKKGQVRISIPDSWISKTPEERLKVFIPDPPEYDDHKFRRCLGHIALNYVAWKFGWATALESRYDPLRRFARYGNRSETWPYGQVQYEEGQPRKQLSLGVVEEAPGLYIRLVSYVDDFYIDPLNDGGLEEWVRRQRGVEVHYF